MEVNFAYSVILIIVRDWLSKNTFRDQNSNGDCIRLNDIMMVFEQQEQI